MTDEKKIKSLDKHYDGIEEHDHPLPNWWVMIFILSIIFSVLYYGYYEMAGGPSLDQELAQDMQEIQQQQANNAPKPGEIKSELLAKIKDEAFLASGKKVFAEKCFMCHGDKGQGLVGPNLTDKYWLHGKGTLQDLVTVITAGVPDKGMPTWGPLLKEEEIVAVAAFISTLEGTNPPNPKAPQGELVQ